jgi:hypothetical protein
MKTQQAFECLVPAVRWSARVTGGLLVGFWLVMVIGYGGLPNVFAQPAAVQLEFLATAMMITGFISGWWREAVGGVVALAGFALFCGVEIAVNSSLPGGAIPLFCIPGLLLVASSIVSRRRAKLQPHGTR